jgi:hypothetical protein
MPLEQELKYFNTIRNDLIAKNHQGKFALVKGDRLVGTFDQPEMAYAEGVKQFGTEPFLVKEILQDEPIETVPTLTVGLPNARL